MLRAYQVSQALQALQSLLAAESAQVVGRCLKKPCAWPEEAQMYVQSLEEGSKGISPEACACACTSCRVVVVVVGRDCFGGSRPVASMWFCSQRCQPKTAKVAVRDCACHLPALGHQLSSRSQLMLPGRTTRRWQVGLSRPGYRVPTSSREATRWSRHREQNKQQGEFVPSECVISRPPAAR